MFEDSARFGLEESKRVEIAQEAAQVMFLPAFVSSSRCFRCANMRVLALLLLLAAAWRAQVRTHSPATRQSLCAGAARSARLFISAECTPDDRHIAGRGGVAGAGALPPLAPPPPCVTRLRCNLPACAGR